MSVLNMSVILPLVIVLFVYGVYCPGLRRPRAQSLPSNYRLESCSTDSQNLALNSPTALEFQCGDANPAACRLLVRSQGEDNYYAFRKDDVEFTSMMEEEITLSVRGSPQSQWSVTCYFTSVTLAQQFYKLITRDRRSELVSFARADYVKTAANTVLSEQTNLYRKGQGNSTTIVVNNNAGDAALIFRKNAVSGIIQEPTKIEFYVTSPDRFRQTFYKFGFSTPSEALSLMRLIN